MYKYIAKVEKYNLSKNDRKKCRYSLKLFIPPTPNGLFTQAHGVY